MVTKRKFIQVGVLGFIFSIFGWKFLKGDNESSVGKLKMLTPDGKLVEVDKSKVKINPNQKPVSNAEIKQWMKSK